ncbi:MAG: ATPase, partial [Acaryochloris sp. SU_5_25]|nr:ATPase [Acaryochloris sp. SU_5_25]
WNDRPTKIKVHDLRQIILGREAIDLTQVEQLVESGQLRAIAAAIQWLHRQYPGSNLSFAAGIAAVMSTVAAAGLSSLSPFPESDFVYFRRFELAAALNRWRSLRIED